MHYQFLTRRGALNDAVEQIHAPPVDPLADLIVPRSILQLVPEAVARENLIIPMSLAGDRVTCATVNAADVMLADKLRFILNKDVRLVAAPRESILRALQRYYPREDEKSFAGMGVL